MRLILKKPADRHLKRRGEVEQPFVEQSTLAVLDIHQHVAGDSGAQRKCLLGKSSVYPQCANSRSDLMPAEPPSGYTVRIVLTRSRGHVSQ